MVVCLLDNARDFKVTKVLVIGMAKISAMAIGGDDGDGDADLVQHPLHVHWRLGNREQRHRTWQGPRSVADWYFDS